MPTFVDDLKTIQEQLSLLTEALRGTPFADSAALLRAQAAADRSILKMSLAHEKKKREEAEKELEAVRARTALLNACDSWRGRASALPRLWGCAGAGAGAGGEAPPADTSALVRLLLARGGPAEAVAEPFAPATAEPAPQQPQTEYTDDEDLYS